MNPFLLKGYNGQRYFCDREKETNSILSALSNGQDITLYALRRMGKSALIHHVFHRLKKEYNAVYIDLWGTTSLNTFMTEFAAAVINSSLFSRRSLSKKLLDFIRSLGASLSFGLDGRPNLEFGQFGNQQYFNNLDEIFAFLESQSKPVIIAIDEFQEIRKYEDGEVLEAKLRSLIQKYPSLHFIYSGSEQHLLSSIFSESSKPFYQSTRMMELGKIDRAEYKKFIVRMFRGGKKTISEELVDYLLDISHTHTYYVQAICNFLYSQDTVPEDIETFNRIYSEYIEEKRVFYRELPERMTTLQFATLKAIARKRKVDQPTSSVFLESAQIKSASSMQRIMEYLEDKQFIIEEEGEYRLYDVFLEHFLRYRN